MKKIIENFSFVVDEASEGLRLDKFLSESIEDATRSYIEKLFDEDLIKLDDKVCRKKGTKLKINQVVDISIPEEENLDLVPEKIELDIVYENKDFLVVNKQAGLVVHPAHGNYSGTLVNALLYYSKELSDINGLIRPGIIHRLDKDTSGLLIIAKNNNAHSKLATIFVDKKIKKTYICIVKGTFSEENKKGRIESLIGRDTKDRKKMSVVDKNGKNAITNYEVIDVKNNHSLVLVHIETGRTHQIRVHMKHLNHPILGDAVYGKETKLAKRQMLHAYKLEFLNPIDNKNYSFVGNLAEDFKKVCKSLEFNLENLEEKLS